MEVYVDHEEVTISNVMSTAAERSKFLSSIRKKNYKVPCETCRFDSTCDGPCHLLKITDELQRKADKKEIKQEVLYVFKNKKNFKR
jgi:radical SAM protein with 4Fe4S-binding SPASM domain